MRKRDREKKRWMKEPEDKRSGRRKSVERDKQRNAKREKRGERRR